MDKIQNENIRKTMGINKLGGKLREIRLRWLRHVVRQEEEYRSLQLKEGGEAN